jgi:hypothetical protein
LNENARDKLSRMLREAREAKGVTLAQAEVATRVRGKYLRGLEAGDWSALPEPLYVRGFIRSYARYLGLDAATALALYEQEHKGPLPKADVKPAMRPLRVPASAWTGIAIGLLVFAFFAGLLAYVYRQWVASTPPPTPISILEVPTATPLPTATRVPLLEVTMPDLVGRELSLVELDLRALGLPLEVGDRRFDTRVAAGRIITQSVPAGVKVRQGLTVTVALSRGREGISVPNVVNITFDQARNMLIGVGFNVERRDAASTQAAGTVFRQDPAPLSTAQVGSTVVVFVSQGGGVAPPAAGKITVPNIVGRPWSEAQKTLAAAGLQVRSVSLQDVELVPPGYVLSTSPGAGAQVDPGSSIDVAVRRE